MHITKQILFIANAKKAQEFQKQLSLFTQKVLTNGDFKSCEVYQCDEDSNEFLFFVQCTTQSSFKLFESTLLKEFEEKNGGLIIKKEILRLD